MTIKTDLGYIEITTEVLAGIAGYAASLCFGVKGMTIRSMTDGLAHLLGRENQSRGVKVKGQALTFPWRQQCLVHLVFWSQSS